MPLESYCGSQRRNAQLRPRPLDDSGVHVAAGYLGALITQQAHQRIANLARALHDDMPTSERITAKEPRAGGLDA